MQANGFPLAGMIFTAVLLSGNTDARLAVTEQRGNDTASGWRNERMDMVDEDDFPFPERPEAADLNIQACLPPGRCALGAEFCAEADESDSRTFGDGASDVCSSRTLRSPVGCELELLPNRSGETTRIVDRNLASAVLWKTSPTIES